MSSRCAFANYISNFRYWSSSFGSQPGSSNSPGWSLMEVTGDLTISAMQSYTVTHAYAGDFPTQAWYPMFLSYSFSYQMGSSTNYTLDLENKGFRWTHPLRPVVFIDLDMVSLDCSGSGSSGNPYTLTAK